MAAILAAVGDIVTAAVSWIGTYLSFIVKTVSVGDGGETALANPLLLLFILLPLVGLGIGLLKRLMSV